MDDSAEKRSGEVGKDQTPTNGAPVIYTLREFAHLIGRSVSTLKSWDRKEILVAKRYPSGQRFYTHSQLTTILEGRSGVDTD